MIRRYGTNNNFYFQMNTGGNTASVTTGGDNLVTNAWRHIAVTISSSGTWKLYDGGSPNGQAAPGYGMPAWPSCFVAHFGYNEILSLSSFQYYPYELSAGQARFPGASCTIHSRALPAHS